MLLPRGSTISLEPLGRALLSFVDLQYVDLGSTTGALEDVAPDTFKYAVRSFGRHLYDNIESEEAVRRGLAYTLNVSDEEFARLVRTLRVPYPRFDPGGVRRLLVVLWDRYFAPWQYDTLVPAPPAEYLHVEWGDR